MAEQLKQKGINVICGWKLCCNCHQKTANLANEVDINECDSGDISELEMSLQIVEWSETWNKSFRIIGTSPLKTHAVARTTKIKAALDKLGQSWNDKQHFRIARYLLAGHKRNCDWEGDKREGLWFWQADFNEGETKCQFIENMSESTTSCNGSWLAKATYCQVFQCVSTWFILLVSWLGRRRCWHFLKLNMASVCQRKLKIWSKYFTNMINIHGWYQEQEIVSVTHNVHQQKHLLLCNLKVSYQSNKEKFPEHKIGLSKFCELWSKWCIRISSSCNHFVCFCTVHQNTKWLMLFAIPSTRAPRNVKGSSTKTRKNKWSIWRTRRWTWRWNRRRLHFV